MARLEENPAAAQLVETTCPQVRWDATVFLRRQPGAEEPQIHQLWLRAGVWRGDEDGARLQAARAGAVGWNFSWPFPNLSVFEHKTSGFHSFLQIHSRCDYSRFFSASIPWGLAIQARTRHLLPAVTCCSLSPCSNTTP